MKYSTKLSDAVHILSFIEINPSSDLSSTAIAKSVQTNPGFVRQIMMCLRGAGLIQSVTGHAKPTLTRNAKEITGNGTVKIFPIPPVTYNGKSFLLNRIAPIAYVITAITPSTINFHTKDIST